MRAFDYMQSENIIYLKRGTGYFGQENTIQRKEFFQETLPETFASMKLLDIDINEIIEKYNQNILES